MIGALYILLSLVIVGVILYVLELRNRKRSAGDAELEDTGDREPESVDKGDGGCCGQHIVCEKDSLSPFGEEIVYYDDEELDRFAGKDPGDYMPDEVEEIRDVLFTLREDDVAGWTRSIVQRGIELPTEIREELLMIVRERRGIK